MMIPGISRNTDIRLKMMDLIRTIPMSAPIRYCMNIIATSPPIVVSDEPVISGIAFERAMIVASLGANCTIVCGTTVGEYALIAAGSVVTKDVLPYALMAGVPARRIGWVCECGKVLGDTLTCDVCGRKYDLTDGKLSEIKQ